MKIVFVFSLFALAKGYPNGAPPGICQRDPTEQPKPNHHGIPPQTGDAPYNVYSSVEGNNLIVMIEPIAPETDLRGFLVYFEDESIIGTWENDDVTHQLPCGSATHDHKRKKTSVKLTWTPASPVSFKDLKLRAVVVKDFATYWINIPVTFRAQGSQLNPTIPSKLSPITPKTKETTTAPKVSLATASTKETTTVPPVPKSGIALPGLATSTAKSTVSTSTTPGSRFKQSSTTDRHAIATPSSAATSRTTANADDPWSGLANFNKQTSSSPSTLTSSTAKSLKPDSKPTNSDSDPWSSLFNFNKEAASTTTTSTTTTVKTERKASKSDNPWSDLLEFNQEKTPSTTTFRVSVAVTTKGSPSVTSKSLSTTTSKATTTTSKATTKTSRATTTTSRATTTTSTTPSTTTKSPGFFSRLFGKSNKKSTTTTAPDDSLITTNLPVIEDKPSITTVSSETTKSGRKGFFSG